MVEQEMQCLFGVTLGDLTSDPNTEAERHWQSMVSGQHGDVEHIDVQVRRSERNNALIHQAACKRIADWHLPHACSSVRRCHGEE